MKGIKAGAIGDVGCFSFFATKTITTAEGGMFTTNNKKLYELALSLREREEIGKKRRTLWHWLEKLQSSRNFSSDWLEPIFKY